MCIFRVSRAISQMSSDFGISPGFLVMTVRQRGQKGEISKKEGDLGAGKETIPTPTKTKAGLVPGFVHRAYEKVIQTVQNFVKSHRHWLFFSSFCTTSSRR